MLYTLLRARVGLVLGLGFRVRVRVSRDIRLLSVASVLRRPHPYFKHKYMEDRIFMCVCVCGRGAGGGSNKK